MSFTNGSLVSKVKINDLVAFAEGIAGWLRSLISIRIANSLVSTSKALIRKAFLIKRASIRRASKAKKSVFRGLLILVSSKTASNIAKKYSNSVSSLVYRQYVFSLL
jgi:hypothetical protein